MIPRIIHFVWLGPMLEWVADNIRRFEALNPEHEIRICDNSDDLLPEYADAYRAAPSISAQSDLIRLSVLERHGGWYFDTDTFALRPIADIERFNYIGDLLFIPSSRGTTALSNPILAASKSCKVWPAVHKFIEDTELPQEHLAFANDLMTHLRLSHPSLVKLGRPDDFAVRGEHNLLTYNKLKEGVEVDTKAYVIHGYIGHGTGRKPWTGAA